MQMPRRFSPWLLFPAVLLCLWAAGLLVGSYVAAPHSRPTPLPQVEPILSQIKQLGQLHTARFEVRDVVEHETAKHPKGWVRSLPGAEGLYRTTTKNSVVVTAEGGVEAGIDLTGLGKEQVSITRTPSGPRVRVRLPKATIYRPDLRIRVEKRQAGLFWNDENIVPAATEEVERRCLEAVKQRGILAAAETNAVKILAEVTSVTGGRSVEFYF
jgi:hypothetical protein